MPGRLPTNPKLEIIFSRDLKELESLPQKVEQYFQIVVEKYGYVIKHAAQLYVPVDQGAAKASIYLLTNTIDEKDEAYSDAKSVARTEESIWHHKGRDLQFAEDDPDEQKVGPMMALICVGVIYGAWLEYEDYTLHATNPGVRHPYLTPAFLQYEQEFLNACALVFDKIK